MFETRKEYKEVLNKEKNPKSCCKSCGAEDFDRLTTEKDNKGNAVSAIFICKNCGIQKNVDYREMEVNFEGNDGKSIDI